MHSSRYYLARVSRHTLILLTLVFALVGIAFTGVFFAIRWQITDVPGEADLYSAEFAYAYEEQTQQAQAQSTASTDDTPTTIDLAALHKLSVTEIDDEVKRYEASIEELHTLKQRKHESLCTIHVVSQYGGWHANEMLRVYRPTQSDLLMDKMLFALDLHLRDTPGFREQIDACATATSTGSTESATFTEETVQQSIDTSTQRDTKVLPWATTEEWTTITNAIRKDKPLIDEVAKEVGIDPRIIVSSLVVEQLRLFHTQRELFKQAFQPLNILADANKISWGIMSIKEGTAMQIEANLTNTNSPYYLGAQYEHALDFTTADHNSERYERLTSSNHRYSYLYGALYLKQLLTQWEKAGYPIDDRPEIIATLFNISFSHSSPKPDPQVGGSTLDIAGFRYTFGSLGYEFFYSAELMNEFPYILKE